LDADSEPCLQDALALPSGDQQGQVAEAHRRTTLAMTELRSTLRDEHHCLLQVGFTLSASQRLQTSEFMRDMRIGPPGLIM